MKAATKLVSPPVPTCFEFSSPHLRVDEARDKWLLHYLTLYPTVLLTISGAKRGLAFFFFFNCSSVLPPAAMALLPPCGRRAVLSLLEMSQSTSPSGWVVQMLKAAMKGFREHFPINACLALQTIVQNLFCILEAVSSLSSLNSLHHKSLSVPGLMDGWMHLEHEDEDLTF